MAVIPQIVTSPGAVPSTGGSQPRVSPQVDIRAPADPSQALGQAASIEAGAYQTAQRSGEKLAEYGDRFADQYIKAKLNINAADHQAELSKQLHEAEFESSKIADRQAATVDFEGRAAKIRDNFAAQDVNPTVRAAVDAALPNQIALRRAATQNAAFGLESKEQVGKLIGQLDQYNKQAVDATDPRLTEEIIGLANAGIDGRVTGGHLAADLAAKMKVDFGSNVYLTKIEVAMQKDMASGVALYDATKGKLNARDSAKAAVMVEDRRKHVEADSTVSANMPVMGGGTGGDVRSVQADAENTLGFPLKVTSADRSEAHNKEVGGAPGSQHLGQGKALDISLAGLTDEQKLKVYNQFLNDPRVGGIGFYAGHLHVDTRGGQRTTWGAPPAAVAEQVKAWQAGAAAPQGDQLSQWKIAGYRYIQSLVDDKTLDPEARNRQISIASQRLNIGNAIVLEQRKSAADTGEELAIKLNTGQYTIGGFQQVSDQFRAAGDNSNAEAYQILANNEAQLIEDAKNPPAQRSAASMLLPGAGGRIAAQQHAQVVADTTERRRLEAAHRTENRQAGAAEEKVIDDSIGTDVNPEALKQNMRNALAYYRAAGDQAKATRLEEKFNAMIDGGIMAKMPPAERNRLKLELQEIANSKDGLSIRDSTLMKILDRKETDNQQRWEQDPLTAAHNIGPKYGGISMQPFNSAVLADPVAAQMWANQRLSDLTQATLRRDGNASKLPSQFFTPTEMSDITQKLETMKPLEAQQFLARLAATVPKQAIALIGEQMSKKDPVSDAYAGALGLFARGQPGDVDIANSIIVGMNWQNKGGPDGKTRIGDDKLAQSTIDDALGKARAGMSPDNVRLQNNVIMAHYVGLTANKPDRTSVDTTMLTKAITDIVGRPATINGGATLMPREIEEYQFRNGVAAITPADVAGLQPTAQGQPITAEVVRQNGQFVPVGDGKYQVRIPDPLRSGRTVQLMETPTRPWVVDIKPLIARGVTGASPTGQPDRYNRNRPQPSPDVPIGPTNPAGGPR